MQKHTGGGTAWITDFVHILHTDIVWCSIDNYGIFLSQAFSPRLLEGGPLGSHLSPGFGVESWLYLSALYSKGFYTDLMKSIPAKAWPL